MFLTADRRTQPQQPQSQRWRQWTLSFYPLTSAIMFMVSSWNQSRLHLTEEGLFVCRNGDERVGQKDLAQPGSGRESSRSWLLYMIASLFIVYFIGSTLYSYLTWFKLLEVVPIKEGKLLYVKKLYMHRK